MRRLPALTTICGTCLAMQPSFDRTIAPFDYQPPISKLIMQLKFQRQLGHAKILAQLLEPYLIQHHSAQHCPELLIPVPLHRSRLQQRGFNQAHQIAKHIHKIRHIPIDTTTIIRKKATQAQATLPAKQRLLNVKQAFTLAAPINASHVAIIDDVITTGHTINAISKLLKQHGVKTVEVWTIARAQLTIT